MTKKQAKDLDAYCDLIPCNGNSWVDSEFIESELPTEPNFRQKAKWAINGVLYAFYYIHLKVYVSINGKNYLVK